MRPAQQFCEQCLSFLNWLPPQIAPVQFKQVERAMPALASAGCRRINSKDRKSVLVANDPDFYSSFFIFSTS
jgi:hypothetical protein